MSRLFWVWFAVCFVCFLVRTVFSLLRVRHERIRGNKTLVGVIYVVMFILWFSWFQMCFTDTIVIELPIWLRYGGLVLFVAGIALFLLSHLRLGRVTERGHVVTGGIYSKIRNPMYLGFIIWVIGFPVYLQRLLTMVSSVIWIAHFMIWKTLEERELLTTYPEYRAYKEKTWF